MTLIAAAIEADVDPTDPNALTTVITGQNAHHDRSRSPPSGHPGQRLPGWYLPWYDQRVKVDKLSISFDPDLGDAVRAAAKREGGGLSRWLAEAAAAKLRADALTEYLDSWEAEHGPLGVAELEAAARELGLPAATPTDRAA